MSRPMNMLRTRRKDCNVKPNRRDAKLSRLDRKSSRGMLYENEELRLKTININAEVESRQSDIKKLKRENEMLKKGLWYLRDEYDKLEKLIKDKKIDFSSSSTTCSSSSSESDSCSSCSEESEEVETTQNIKNVQRTNLKNIQDQFDHLSVVTEETSADNSEQNSNRASLPSENWNNFEKDIIKPDQSYPVYENIPNSKSQTLPVQDKVPTNFFSPIQTSRSFDDGHFNQQNAGIYPGEFYTTPVNIAEEHVENNFDNSVSDQTTNLGSFQQFDQKCEDFLGQNMVQTNARSFYQNMVLVPKTTKPLPEAKAMEKTSTDLIVKIDNKSFNNNSLVFSNTPSQSTFSNGGNLEELLNDIESISQEILRISNLQRGLHPQNIPDRSGTFQGDFVQDIPMDDQFIQSNGDHFVEENYENIPGTPEKPYKSELNVVLMPNPMPLIGFDKYRNIQRSLESLNSKPLEELSASQQNLCVIPPPPPGDPPSSIPPPLFLEENGVRRACDEDETNPFFFGNLKDNYVNSDYFNMRYNPENFKSNDEQKQERDKNDQKSGSKINLLDLTPSEHISSENEENLKFKTTKPEKTDEKTQQKAEQHQQEVKSPKLSIRRKVSIHFKGKKEKNKKVNLDVTPETSKPKTPADKKHSLFDIRFNDADKNKDKEKGKIFHQKTPSIESKKSTTETSNQEQKTPTSTDSKASNDKKNYVSNEKKEASSEKKLRKSVSVSPDRSKHVHLKDEGSKKHKKHKKGDRSRRRPSVAEARNLRERSFSVCTDRSNILEHRLGLGLGFGSSFLYDDYSDRERTNSLSSCETGDNVRKLSSTSNMPLGGKVPWCGCWGNGCL